MTHTQGGGDDSDPGEINIFYQWRGAYSKEQMGKEVARVEEFVNAHRKDFHIERVYSRYSEQGWAQTRLFLDIEDREQSKKIEEEVRKGLPASARAKIGIGWPGGMGSDGEGIRFSLIGDSSQTLEELAGDVVPIPARAIPSCATCGSTPATRTPSWPSRSTGSVPPPTASARRWWRSTWAWPCAVRRCATSIATTWRSRSTCALPARTTTAWRTCPRSCCARPMAPKCRCWRWCGSA